MEEYLHDRINMTEWIWQKFDNDKHYLLNMTELASNLLHKMLTNQI